MLHSAGLKNNFRVHTPDLNPRQRQDQDLIYTLKITHETQTGLEDNSNTKQLFTAVSFNLMVVFYKVKQRD